MSPKPTGVFEIDMSLRPTEKLTLNAMFSAGDWFYNNSFTAVGTNIDTQQSEGELTIHAKDLPVGDAAQTTMSLGGSYRALKGLRLNINWRYAGRVFAQYDIDDSQFLSDGGEITELPSYSLMDMGINYTLDMKGLKSLSFRLSMNNVLDTEYIAELDTIIKDDPATSNRNEFYDNRGFYGFGRTWSMGMKFKF